MREGFFPPWVLQGTGIAAFFFFIGFWAFTSRVEPTLLAFSGTLIGAGIYQSARKQLTNPEPPPPPPPAATVREGNGA